MIILTCGYQTIRFRPSLVTSKEDVELGIDILKKVIRSVV